MVCIRDYFYRAITVTGSLKSSLHLGTTFYLDDNLPVAENSEPADIR